MDPKRKCLRIDDVAAVGGLQLSGGSLPKISFQLSTPFTFTQKMKAKIDSIKGRLIYNRRLAIAEPPFAHIKSILGLDRFSLRGKRKVNTQWLLYCIVHNLTKVHRYAEGFA